MMTAKLTQKKEILKIFDNIESAKDVMLEANPDLERSMTIHQGSFYIISCQEGDKHHTKCTSLFSQRNKPL